MFAVGEVSYFVHECHYKDGSISDFLSAPSDPPMSNICTWIIPTYLHYCCPDVLTAAAVLIGGV